MLRNAYLPKLMPMIARLRGAALAMVVVGGLALVAQDALERRLQVLQSTTDNSEPAYLTEPPTPAPSGLAAAMAELRVDKLANVMEAVATAPAPGQIGGPRAGLGWQALADFYDGFLAFHRAFAANDGLGPVYNDVSCGACHRAPTAGGGGRDMGDGITVHGPPETNGDAMGVRKHAVAGHRRELAHGKTARLRTPPLYGLGELDAIPDATIDANVDAADRDGDGVIGLRGVRYGRGGKPGVTRFGQKANEWNLRRFIAGALFDEMGVTSTVRRQPLPDRDAVSDPEVSSSFIDRLDSYVRGLARPPPAAPTKRTEAGEKRFADLGCTACHRPVLGEVKGAYTDLLLHNMGPALDSGLKDGIATGRHWRTAPLWGLRLRPRLLHDERAGSIHEAVAHHKGEASRASAAFFRLNDAERAEVEAFLLSL